MGRPAKSPQQNWLQGTKSQAANGPAAFVGGRPRMPKGLGPIAKKAFRRAVQLLENRRTLTPSDETTLELYARCYERWQLATAEAGADLMVDVQITDSHGTLRTVRRINPLLKIITDAETKLLAFAKALGFTQTDIGRCKTTALDEKNEVVPGSVQEQFPEFWDANGKYVGAAKKDAPLQFVPMPPPAEAEDEENV
jgi:P27 family predicted phage terminase small subunit